MSVEFTIEQRNTYLYIDVSGNYNSIKKIENVKRAAKIIHENNCQKVLLNFMKMTNSNLPEMDRYIIGAEIVKQIGIHRKIAIVWKEKHINHFTETVVRNRGGDFRVFFNFENAELWLLN